MPTAADVGCSPGRPAGSGSAADGLGRLQDVLRPLQVELLPFTVGLVTECLGVPVEVGLAVQRDAVAGGEISGGRRRRCISQQPNSRSGKTLITAAASPPGRWCANAFEACFHHRAMCLYSEVHMESHVRTDTIAYINTVIGGYCSMLTMKIEEGYTPYILSLMYKPLRGPLDWVLGEMEGGITQAYKTLLLRVARKPRSPAHRHRLPEWILIPDWPVPKRARASPREVSLNNGLHYQGLALIPPRSRLREPLDEHFETHQALYTWGPVERIHAEPITHDHRRVVLYLFKSLQRRRADFDSIIMLPKAISELEAPPKPVAEPYRHPFRA